MEDAQENKGWDLWEGRAWELYKNWQPHKSGMEVVMQCKLLCVHKLGVVCLFEEVRAGRYGPTLQPITSGGGNARA